MYSSYILRYLLNFHCVVVYFERISSIRNSDGSICANKHINYDEYDARNYVWFPASPLAQEAAQIILLSE